MDAIKKELNPIDTAVRINCFCDYLDFADAQSLIAAL